MLEQQGKPGAENLYLWDLEGIATLPTLKKFWTFTKLKALPRDRVVLPSSQAGIVRSYLDSSHNLRGILVSLRSQASYTGPRGNYGMLFRAEQLHPHSQCQTRAWGPHFTNEMQTLNITLIQGLSLCMFIVPRPTTQTCVTVTEAA